MKALPRFPLLAKVFVWLLLHLTMLLLGFLLFVYWQLGLGLDSLLSGSAGERLKGFGDEVLESIMQMDRSEWDDEVTKQAAQKGLRATLVFSQQEISLSGDVPDNVRLRLGDIVPPQSPPQPLGSEKAQVAAPQRNTPPNRMQQPQEGPGMPSFQPPQMGGRPPYPPPHMRMQRGEMPSGPQGGYGQGQEMWRSHAPASGGMLQNQAGFTRQGPSFVPETRPLFLVRGDEGNGYWAGVAVHFPPLGNMPRLPGVLLIRSESLDGAGMFFDFKPWLRGGLAVLVLSLIFWTPFVWKISSYLKRLTIAADGIAAGKFHVSIPERGNDELGNLGRTIQSMAARLDHLVSGQKRFLGDAAHELCGPLARVRTGLGILETKLQGADAASLESIDADVAELAGLVNEILSFSRAGKLEPVRKRVALRSVAMQAMARESVDCEVLLRVPENVWVTTDPVLLGRAIGNLIRNASIHAGPHVTVTIDAESKGGMVAITVQDNGPGVPPHELAHLFEPFYRLDKSRSRDSGGSGLGLAIVRTSVEACGGEVQAFLPEKGGFGVMLKLPDPSLNAGRA